MKVLTAVGTRPQFNYQVLLAKEFRRQGVQEILVHTGQHYDQQMSGQFFTELELPTPDVTLQVPTGLHGAQTGAILSSIEALIQQEQPDVVLVHGDVNSSTAAALAAVKLRVPVAHIEAGLRARFYRIPQEGESEGLFDPSLSAWRFNYYNPEEINRRLTDHSSELQFPHIQEAYDSLIAEGFRPDLVFNVGDILNDTLLYSLDKFGVVVKNEGYVAVTIHRAENTDNPTRLTQIAEALIGCEMPVRFPVHPRTLQQLDRLGLLAKFRQQPRIELLPPLSYRESIRLLAHSDRVLTDSGGVRREAYILGKPVITAIEIVWVPSMITLGWKYVAGANYDRIIYGLQNHQPTGPREPIFGDGSAHKRIIQTLIEHYDTERI